MGHLRGSGKTVLLNALLRQPGFADSAIVVNEFGEVGIDNELVINANEEIFEMNNGCICCTVRGDLIRILGNLVKRRDKFDRIVVEAAREFGISVSNTPDVLTDDVADIAVALVLMTSRRLVESNRFLHDSKWLGGPFPLAHALRGKVAGILGLGRIGKAIAQRLEAHGMKIAYHGRKAQNVPWSYFDDLKALAAESDFLIVACPGGPETVKLVDAEVLAALGSEGTLINIARGSVVERVALQLRRQNKNEFWTARRSETAETRAKFRASTGRRDASRRHPRSSRTSSRRASRPSTS